MNKNIKSKRNSLHLYLGVLVFMLLIIQVIVSNRLAIYGNQISQIDQKMESINQENINISEKIASASSLIVIKQKSLEMGFNQTITPYYVSDNLPVALGLH